MSSNNRESGNLGVPIGSEDCNDVERSGDESFNVDVKVYGAAFQKYNMYPQAESKEEISESPISGSHDNAGSTDAGKDSKADY